MPKVDFAPVDKKEIELNNFFLNEGFRKESENVWSRRPSIFDKKQYISINDYESIPCTVNIENITIEQAFRVCSYVESVFGKEFKIRTYTHNGYYGF